MLESIEEAEKAGNIYFSTRLVEGGKQQWISLLKQAAKDHNEHWLAYQLETNVLLNDFEFSRKPSGGYTHKHVPHTAAQTLADGQFNRFYMLGLCKRAKSDGVNYLEVYRAKENRSSRSMSQELIGTKFLVAEIEPQLQNLKASFCSNLLKPNSGISIKYP